MSSANCIIASIAIRPKGTLITKSTVTAFRDQVTILGLTMKVWGEYEKLDGVKNDKENGRERRKRRQLCELNNRSMRSGSPAYFTSCSYEIVQWCNIPISDETKSDELKPKMKDYYELYRFRKENAPHIRTINASN
uniref:DDE_Tnp_1_7 domain-containing protein n=1 Tax=Ascaris lumbricoides TaxID=6252 RepID=A0A0M3HQJ2_ASCLU